MSLSIMAAVGLTIETDRVISCIEWDSQRGCKVRSKSRSSRGGGAEGAKIADAGDATQGERESNGMDLEESGVEEEREDVCDCVVRAEAGRLFRCRRDQAAQLRARVLPLELLL